MDIVKLNRAITEATEERNVCQCELDDANDRLTALRGQRIAALRQTALDIGLERQQLVTFSDGRQLVGLWGYPDRRQAFQHCIGSIAGFFQPTGGQLIRIELDSLHFVEVWEG